MIPKRNTKLDEFIDMINEIVEGRTPQIDFEQLMAEAKKIEPRDYIDFKMALGMIAAVRGDLAEVVKQFRAANMASGQHNVNVLKSYSAALLNIQHLDEAVQIIDDLARDNPDDISVLRDALKAHISSFDVEGAKHFLQRLNAVGVHDMDELTSLQIEKMTEVLNSFQVTGKQICDRLTLASDTVFNAGQIARTVVDIFHISGIVFEFHIQGDIEEAVVAEAAIQEAIAKSTFSPADTCVAFHCVPHECQAS